MRLSVSDEILRHLHERIQQIDNRRDVIKAEDADLLRIRDHYVGVIKSEREEAEQQHLNATPIFETVHTRTVTKAGNLQDKIIEALSGNEAFRKDLAETLPVAGRQLSYALKVLVTQGKVEAIVPVKHNDVLAGLTIYRLVRSTP